MKDEETMIAPAQLANQLKASKTLRDALEVLEQCYEIHASLTHQLIDAHSVKLACHEGCDLCCSYRVTAKAHEVLLIAETVQNGWNLTQKSRLIERLKKHASLVKELTIEQHLTTNVQCPLLLDHRCSVYLVRPLGCRRHHARDFEGCKFCYENPNDMQFQGTRHPQLSLEILHNESIITNIFTSNYFDQTEYELGLALLEALTSKKSANRWRDHKKAFLQTGQKNKTER